MKRSYTLSILSLLLIFCSCSKDFLKSYDTRIIGVWKITDVERLGIGGTTDNMTFKNGTFTFYDNGTLDYTTLSNTTFKGSWDITKKYYNDETTHTLQITAVDFTNQQVLTEYYDDMNFVSTNHFKTTINSGLHAYVTHFKR